MQLNLDQRVFAVTGAAQGIGAAIVESLVAEGAIVAAIDIDADGLSRLEMLQGVTCHSGDLGSPDSAHAICKEIIDQHGHVDGLVTAAGGVRGQIGRPLEEITPADWQAIFAANVDAAMWCAQGFAPAMKQRGWGRIVTISSGAGLKPSLTGIQAYASAKHALVGLTRQLALELGPAGITVNSVAPGFVLSNPSTERQWQAFGAERQAQIVNSIHTRRLGRAEDIADAVTFLCSDKAGWITGQILQVDGGHA
ncbi:SDR family NAD(P)-dependent oxidoreductase [Granulosicoccus antarcticus]|uniref:3-oxoacyl-[acyl-carrier-protein] reductase 2 n=1 Tax=Granulosicoccus antarcticus IMCC3135 TaxID=1192854 RepID=A0A2Z2NMZ6_9GAMM|nr:SDR family oxidoreductase [Granulosicoccus antarcticus]ASJ72756.1 3-oxoacyl-[acyl-carrier-protein] reductase 2 [Granulosicoccus antarcticus IMCC3135]